MFDDTEFHRAIVSASFAMVRAMVAGWWVGRGEVRGIREIREIREVRG